MLTAGLPHSCECTVLTEYLAVVAPTSGLRRPRLSITASRQGRELIPVREDLSNTPASEMVTIRLARSAPLNSPGQSTVLTHAQAWSGLMRKAREPQLFVPVVETCEILSETDDEVSCVITFKSGVAHKRRIREVCKLNRPCQLYYEMEDGSTAYNVISQGPSGEESDLLMTFVFCWEHPDLAPGSDEAKAAENNHRQVSHQEHNAHCRLTSGLGGRQGCGGDDSYYPEAGS